MLPAFTVEVPLLFVVKVHGFVRSSLTLNIDIDGSRPSSPERLSRRRGDRDERKEVRDVWTAYLDTCNNNIQSTATYSPLIHPDKHK